MSDDMMAVMGLAGFGKQKKTQLESGRFDKTKRREQVSLLATSTKLVLINNVIAGSRSRSRRSLAAQGIYASH